MSVQFIEPGHPLFQRPAEFQIGPDRLAAQKLAHRKKADEREVFVPASVSVSTGPKGSPSTVNLRWPKSAEIIEERDDLDNVVARKRVWSNSRFVFAVYSDNPDWHKAARAEWEEAAKNALEKFCAMHSAAITFGPRQEDMNRYNMMVEVRDPLNVPEA